MGLQNSPCRLRFVEPRVSPMIFLLRAVFWTAVVVAFVPGATVGTGRNDQFQTLESLKADAILTLARVRMELNARDLRAR